MASPVRRPWSLALGAGVLAAVAALAATGLPTPAARAQPATLLAPPACSCSEALNVSGTQLQNCTCGALQCVVATRPMVSVEPTLACVK